MMADPQGTPAKETPAHGPDDTARTASPVSTAPTDLSPTEEPTTTGTLFLMLLFLMLIAGFWGMMYVMLLNR